MVILSKVVNISPVGFADAFKVHYFAFYMNGFLVDSIQPHLNLVRLPFTAHKASGNEKKKEKINLELNVLG
jgi:hypothetical protein